MVTATPETLNSIAPPTRANVRRTGDFPADQFVLIPDVPVFAEHETTGRDGRELNFGPTELGALVKRCNQRIQETGDYAAITLGHTPEPGSGEQPEVVGFAGPFHLGTLGEENPKTVVLADFHVFLDQQDTIRRFPRRSPELWLEDSYDEMFLDPIALLGAEAPRLDMGLLYSASRHGRNIEKYTAVAPAAGNVCIRTDDLDKNKKTYSAEGNTMGNGELSPDAITQVIEVIDQLDWVKDIKAMAAGQGGNNATPPMPTAVPQAAQDPMQPGAAPPEEVPELLPDDPNPGGLLDGGSTEEPEADAMSDDRTKILDEMNDEDFEKYAAGRKAKYEAGEDEAPDDLESLEDPEDFPISESVANDPDIAGPPGEQPEIEEEEEDDDEKENYSRPRLQRSLSTAQAEIARLREENSKLQTVLFGEQKQRVNAERYQLLSDKRQRFAFDIEKEAERCKYARGGMTDKQFDIHMQSIEENYRPIPIGSHYLPTHGTGATDPNGAKAPAGREKYNKDRSEKAFAICERKRLSGESVDYLAVLEGLESGETVE